VVYHYRHQGQRWGDPGMSMPANQKAVIWVGVKLLAPPEITYFLMFSTQKLHGRACGMAFSSWPKHFQTKIIGV